MIMITRVLVILLICAVRTHGQDRGPSPPSAPTDADLVVAAKALAGVAFAAGTTVEEMSALQQSYAVIQKRLARSPSARRELADADAYFKAVQKANSKTPKAKPTQASSGGNAGNGGSGGFLNGPD